MVERVVKFDRTTERFDRGKIVRSIMSAGGSRTLAERIAYVVEERLRDKPEATTMHIRRIVLTELGRLDNDVKDSFLFYDRVMKGRITYETGKFFIVRDGDLILGGSTQKTRPRKIAHIDDVRCLIEELSEDLWIGGISRKNAERRSKILIDAIRDSTMSKDDKEYAIRLVTDFRQGLFRE